ncbi:MAG: radical SAM protein [Thermodesulfobacteriota bacterium]
MKSFRYLYGPVPSRRLGRSLGIDLVPHKICTYDCIYCQIGRTTVKTQERKEYIPIQEVLGEIEQFLREEASFADYLSLSGSGEPTLNSKIGILIQTLKKRTSIPVAVLTNGSLFYLEEVREDLLNADVVLPSLDAVSQDAFKKINRPLHGFSIKQVIEGLIQFRKRYRGQIWLEILFCRGFNDRKEELIKMKQIIEQIEPDHIHLNTVVRPPSENWAYPLTQEEMKEIEIYFGEKASVLTEFDRHPLFLNKREVKEAIVKILSRRPLSLKDLSRGMKIKKEELEGHLQTLIDEKIIKKRYFDSEVYYEISDTS